MRGTSSSNLMITVVQPNDAGSYTVVVSNSAGAVTSAPPAVLTVLQPPIITLMPSDQTAAPGANVRFTVRATGREPMTYQWTCNGTALTEGGQVVGATSSNLALLSVQARNTGCYAAVVRNPDGVATSVPAAFLNVLGPPWIVVQPGSLAVWPGSNVTISVVASGTAPLSYAWNFYGTNLADGGRICGSGTSQLTLAGVQPSEAGNYTVVITNSSGSATSQIAVLRLVSLTMTPDHHAQLFISGPAGSAYRLEYATNLAQTPWKLWTNFTQAAAVHVFTDSQVSTNTAQRFYRTVPQP